MIEIARLVALVAASVAAFRVMPVLAEPPAAHELDNSSTEQRRIAIFQEALPSVVRIEVARVEPRAPGRQAMDARKTASGFLWDTDGHVVTSQHAIPESHALNVVLADGSRWQARTIGTARDLDLAVLKITAPQDKCSPIRRSRSEALRTGENAPSIGYPFGDEATLHVGIISGLDRDIRSVVGQPLRHLIRTDLAISPGDAGSPLLDDKGQLLGMNTAILRPSRSAVRTSFAVPASSLELALPDLIEHRQVARPTLGVTLANRAVTDQLGLQGVLVLEVLPRGPAAKAGLRETRRDTDGNVMLGDIITDADGRPVRTDEDLRKVLQDRQPGDAIVLTIERNGDERQISVTLEEAPESTF